jgi:hypothetical protein
MFVPLLTVGSQVTCLAPDAFRLMTLTSLLHSDGTEVGGTSSMVCNNGLDTVHRRQRDGQGKLCAA